MSFVEDIRLALNWAFKLCQQNSLDEHPVKRMKLTQTNYLPAEYPLPKNPPIRTRISEKPRPKYEGDLEPILRKRRRKTPPKRRLTLDLTLRNYQSKLDDLDRKRLYISPSKGIRFQEDEAKLPTVPLTHNPFTGEQSFCSLNG